MTANMSAPNGRCGNCGSVWCMGECREEDDPEFEDYMSSVMEEYNEV